MPCIHFTDPPVFIILGDLTDASTRCGATPRGCSITKHKIYGTFKRLVLQVGTLASVPTRVGELRIGEDLLWAEHRCSATQPQCTWQYSQLSHV